MDQNSNTLRRRGRQFEKQRVPFSHNTVLQQHLPSAVALASKSFFQLELCFSLFLCKHHINSVTAVPTKLRSSKKKFFCTERIPWARTARSVPNFNLYVETVLGLRENLALLVNVVQTVIQQHRSSSNPSHLRRSCCILCQCGVAYSRHS